MKDILREYFIKLHLITTGGIYRKGLKRTEVSILSRRAGIYPPFREYYVEMWQFQLTTEQMR
jgi:hypothetical protein